MASRLPAGLGALIESSADAKLGYQRRAEIVALGSRIKRAREADGIGQTELARKIGTSQAHLSDIERGIGAQGPTYAMLLKIAAACKVTVGALVEPVAVHLVTGEAEVVEGRLTL